MTRQFRDRLLWGITWRIMSYEPLRSKIDEILDFEGQHAYMESRRRAAEAGEADDDLPF